MNEKELKKNIVEILTDYSDQDPQGVTYEHRALYDNVFDDVANSIYDIVQKDAEASNSQYKTIEAILKMTKDE